MHPDRAAAVPGVDGVLTPAQVEQTAAVIAAAQEPDGAVPWTVGGHTDVWNHVEAAMALLVGGQVEASDRAFGWCLDTQREDGSWPMKIVAGEVEDHSGETNMSAYLAVGVWHNWLVRSDFDFVRRHWPAVRRGLDWVVSMQLPFGGIAWSREWADGRPATVNREALVAGSSSIYQSLRAGVALSELMDEPQPEWELAGGRLGHALREHRDLFLDKSTFSMDWYYPVLGGAVRGSPRAPAAREPLGRLRRARTRHQVRRHQPVGHRRGDLRAGPRPRRGRGAGEGVAAVRRHAAPARARAAATGPATSTRTT